MPTPRFCPNRDCSHYLDPPKRWYVRIGTYPTIAHGQVQRYRCRSCGTTCSTQTESIHYYAKRRLPMRALAASLNSGSSLRDIGRRYGYSCAAVRNGVLRLGRQAMAAQIILLNTMHARHRIAFDGLRTFVTSQDFPCDITTVVDRDSEVILTMTHAIRGRGGTVKPAQARRLVKKRSRWTPRAGTTKQAISLVADELWNYLRPPDRGCASIDTDEDPLYGAVLRSHVIWRHMVAYGQVVHHTTPGSAARTCGNRLFAVNYVDLLLRHRVKEHTRETIAFGRHATVQMHRAWVFAWDHNMCREYRVKRPELGVHAQQGVVSAACIRGIGRQFYDRRIRLVGRMVPESIARVWLSEIQTPPVRWRAGQSGTMVRIPGFARADLAAGLMMPRSAAG